MPNRKLLKGIAYNLAQWCLSRNNDYDGYWAVGQLYAYAHENNANKVVVDVLKSKLEPNTNKFSTLCKSHKAILKKMLDAISIEEKLLKEVLVEYGFEEPYIPKFHNFGSALGGKPSMCRVKFKTDNNREYLFDSLYFKNDVLYGHLYYKNDMLYDHLRKSTKKNPLDIKDLDKIKDIKKWKKVVFGKEIISVLREFSQ